MIRLADGGALARDLPTSTSWRRCAHPAAHRAANRLRHGAAPHRRRLVAGELTGAAPDPVAVFDRDWAAARNAGGVEYAATQSPESLTATGRALITGFATAWPTFQRLLAVGTDGTPLLELKLEVQLGPRLVYVGRSDLLTFNRDGELECLDLKTPAPRPTWVGWLTPISSPATSCCWTPMSSDWNFHRSSVWACWSWSSARCRPGPAKARSPGPDRGASSFGHRNDRLRPESTLGGGGHRAGPVPQTRPDGAQHPVRAVRGTRSVPIRRPGRLDRAAENRPRQRRLKKRARVDLDRDDVRPRRGGMSPFMGCFTMNRLKELFFVRALLAGCQGIQALDERISERIRRSDGLKPETTVAVVATTRMRSGPGTEYPVIRTLKKGVEVVPLGTTGTWRAIRIGPESGFIRRRDLEPVARPDRHNSSSRSSRVGSTGFDVSTRGVGLGKPHSGRMKPA